MCALFFNSLLNPIILSAQRIQFEPDLPEPPAEEQSTLPLLLTSCENFSNLNFMDAIGSGSAFISNLNGPLHKASQLIQIMGTNDINGLNINIKGIFEIDALITFRNCKVKIEPNGEILVKNRFRTVFTHYFACKGMWNGIKVVDAGTLYLSNFCSIEDAIKAVDVTEKCRSLAITHTTFNRNRTGVFLHSTTTIPSSIIFQNFYKNKFTCTSELNEGGFTSKGIYASAVNVPNLGVVSFTTVPSTPAKDYANIFSGKIGVGIDADNALLNIKYCCFANIDAPGFRLAMGVRAYNSNITLTGIGTPDKAKGSLIPIAKEEEVTFFNCRDMAIQAVQSHLTVSNAYFYFNSTLSENARNIIQSVQNPSAERININNNHFHLGRSTSAPRMIAISRSSAALEIKENTFSARVTNGNNFTRIAVHILSGNSGTGIGDYVEIEKNKLALFSNPSGTVGSWEGIRLDGGKQYFVQDNEIKDLTSEGSIGINTIDIRNSSTSRFMNNKIPEFRSDAIGMRFFNSLVQQSAPRSGAGITGIFICDNEIENCKNGMQFIGSHSVVLANNHYYDNTKALVLENGAVLAARIGLQWKDEKYRKNYFEIESGTNSPSASFPNSAEMPAAGNPSTSQFAVDNRGKQTAGNITGRPFSIAAFDNIVPSAFRTSWFSNEAVTNDVGCKVIDGASALWQSDDDDILNGEYSHSSLALRWESERYLFDKLLNYPELMVGHPEREAFFNQKQNSNIPIFNQLNKKIDDLFELAPSQQTQLDNLNASLSTQKEHWVSTAARYNTEFGENEWSEAAKNVMESLSDNLGNTQSAIAILKAQIEVATNSHIEELIALNATIVTQNTPEGYAKDANHYWLRMMRTKNHLNDQELLGVRTLATTCYKDAGRAKYMAINILPQQETESFINTPCFAGAKVVYNPKQNNDLVLKVMPNPVNDLLTIEVQTVSENPATELLLVDISGRVLKKIDNLTENTNFLMETQELNNGIYFLQLRCKDNSIKVQKVTIVH